MLQLNVPTVVYLQSEFVQQIKREAHPLVDIRGVIDIKTVTTVTLSDIVTVLEFTDTTVISVLNPDQAYQY